jgi:hypothetical protein
MSGGLAAGRGSPGWSGVWTRGRSPILGRSWRMHPGWRVPGCASTLDLRPSPCSRQSPFAVSSPLVELFPPPTSALRAFPLFPQHCSSAHRPPSATTRSHVRGHLHGRDPRDLHRVLHGPSRPPPRNISLACSPRASLLGGHQTLTSLHPIRHGSRPAATTRASGHHNASQSPTPSRLTAEPGQFPNRVISRPRG